MAKKREAPHIGAAEFKARCLELLDRVRESGAEYTITKHGKPVARVVPAAVPAKALRGAFADQIAIAGNIVSVDWTGEWDATS
jgi:prevent-host-death family protein